MPAFAQTASELLQKGIYTQETAGDLDGAVSIYRQIVKSGNTPRDIAAQAQYRLAQSLLQKGDLANGAAEFSNLARNYADYGKLISSLATQAQENAARKSTTPGDSDFQALRAWEDSRRAGTPQPDKALLDNALAQIDRGEYEGARRTLNLMINSYPNSDYLPGAKLAIVDSWLREGGSEGAAQAQAELADFIRFYPNLRASGGSDSGGDPKLAQQIDQLKQTILALELQQQNTDAARSADAVPTAVAMLNQVQAELAARKMKVVMPPLASLTFDPKSPITVKGVIFKQVVVNPSGAVSVDPKDGTGKRYVFLTASPAEMRRLGLTGSALEPGGVVTITGVLAADGRSLGDDAIAARADTITAADGRKLFDRAQLKQASPK